MRRSIVLLPIQIVGIREDPHSFGTYFIPIISAVILMKSVGSYAFFLLDNLLEAGSIVSCIRSFHKLNLII